MPTPGVNLNRFDLTSLRLFVATVEAGSLTAGAERFGISLAAASKRIAELEAHVGTALLSRSKRGAAPTAAGQTLHGHAIEVVARLEQLAVAMDDFRRGTRGHLRLWANPSAFGGFLPRVLAAYAAEHPDVKIDLEEALSEEAVRGVATGVAELAIIGDNTPAEGLQSIVCDVDELVLIVPAHHALAKGKSVSFAQVLDHDFVMLGRSTSLTRHVSAAAEAIGRTLRVRVQARTFEAVCRIVAAGLGLGILPRASAAPQAAALGLELVRLDGMRIERRLLLVMRDRESLSKSARAFVELVEQRRSIVI
ncbi:MAG TPA: LysR family transcriptional regulator [Burkholderiaceae bacterium]|nr:LysR family transcriptional regulator [Burkholderiaceae bacterium]